MKSVFMLLGSALVLTASLTHGPQALASFHAAYPSDLLQSHALSVCSSTTPTFVRFSETDRNGCYERFTAVNQVKVEAPNFIDMRMVASRGHQPQNDIAAQQANARFVAQRTKWVR